MTPMTDAELEDLKAGLGGVTPGPWAIHDDGCALAVTPFNRNAPLIAEMIEQGDATDRGMWGSEYQNAAHLARCSPDKIAALLARLDAAEGGWLPIESAPRDASILVTCAATDLNKTFAGRRDVLPVYRDDDGSFDPNPENEFWQITHWRPFPAPSLAKAGG